MNLIREQIQLIHTQDFWQIFLAQYAASLVLFLLTWLILKLVKVRVISKLYDRAQKSKFKYDNLVTNILNGITSFTYLIVSLYIASFPLQLSEKPTLIIQGLLLFVIVLEVSRAATKTIDFYFNLKHKKSTKSQKTNISAIKKVIQIFLFTFGILAIIDNLGFDITTLVASLGIGGVAVALAAQSILGDLFSSVAIYLDKPFEVGDNIEVTPEIKGKIKSIGIKSTRLKGPKGQEIIISNNNLTNAFVQNTGRIRKRRVKIILGVDYKTPDKTLKQIPLILERITNKVENTEFKLAFIKELGEYSVNYKFVYNVLTGKYSDYAKAHHEIMLQIKKEFDKNNIVLSYPTQTIYIEKS